MIRACSVVCILLLFESVLGIDWYSYLPKSKDGLSGEESALVQWQRNAKLQLANGQKKNLALEQTFQFLDSVMGRSAVDSKCHYEGSYPIFSASFFGDGFCTQFQSLTKTVMYGFQLTDYHKPVIPTGQLTGYSFSEHCDFTQRSLHCYFQHFSPCQSMWEENPDKIQVLYGATFRTTGVFNISMVPERFKSHGTAFWWGAMQYYLLSYLHRRIATDFILNDSLQEMNSFLSTKEVTANIPRVGIHIRHGDRADHSDYTKLEHHTHSIEEAFETMMDSSQCQIRGHHHQCFIGINFFVNNYSNKSGNVEGQNWSYDDDRTHMFRVYTWLKAATNKQTQIVQRGKEQLFHRRNGHNQPDGVLVTEEDINKAISIFEDSCPLIKAGQSTDKLDLSKCGFPNDNSWLSEKNLQWILPLQILVVSDDSAVIQAAREKYHAYAFSAGYSQSSGNKGAAGRLKSTSSNQLFEHPIRATLEILRDVHYLSTCSTLVGSVSSQVFRMAVSMANATAVLQDAIIVDGDELESSKQGADSILLPFPEVFRGSTKKYEGSSNTETSSPPSKGSNGQVHTVPPVRTVSHPVHQQPHSPVRPVSHPVHQQPQSPARQGIHPVYHPQHATRSVLPPRPHL
jgi:hypothetical protein